MVVKVEPAALGGSMNVVFAFNPLVPKGSPFDK